MIDLARCNAAGARIAASVPIVKRSDAEIVERWRLVGEELKALGVVSTRLVWRHTLHEDGGQHGVWASSDEEAVIECAMWWHSPVVAVSVEPVDPSTFPAPEAEATLW